MRLVIDIMGATKMSGGMRLHASEFVKAWGSTFPDDEITVLGPKWAAHEFRNLYKNVVVFEWPNERVFARFLGQTVVGAALRRKKEADFLVSLSPIVSPFAPRRNSVCFQHDWRHVKNPDEFPAHQHFYRKLWTLSAGRALTNACISEKTREETLNIVPGARTQLIANGGDHPARWQLTGHSTENHGTIVTFGHHNNKRPHLVIQGLAHYSRNRTTEERLIVLGARGEYRDELRKLASELGVAHRVDFPGFVSEADYQRIVSSASCIVLPSSDEGYGLPIAEADYFGIPAIATSDSGLDRIFKNLIITEPDGKSMAYALEEALSGWREHPRMTLPTWSDTVDDLRAFLVNASANMPDKQKVMA